MSRKDLHLNESGSWCLAINVLEGTNELWKTERYASIIEEDELTICSEKYNLSNNHVESDKEKDKCPNVNLKSLREENLNRPIFTQISKK